MRIRPSRSVRWRSRSFEFEFYAPSINFTADPSEGKLTLMSNWSLTINSLAEVDNVGNASIESNRFFRESGRSTPAWRNSSAHSTSM